MCEFKRVQLTFSGSRLIEYGITPLLAIFMCYDGWRSQQWPSHIVPLANRIRIFWVTNAPNSRIPQLRQDYGSCDSILGTLRPFASFTKESLHQVCEEKHFHLISFSAHSILYIPYTITNFKSMQSPKINGILNLHHLDIKPIINHSSMYTKTFSHQSIKYLYFKTDNESQLLWYKFTAHIIPVWRTMH